MLQPSSVGPLTSEVTSRRKFPAGEALTTASVAKAERTAKREKRIVIELRIGGKLECLVDWASSFQVALSYTFLLLTEKAGALDPRLAAKREAEFFDPSTSNFCKQSPK